MMNRAFAACVIVLALAGGVVPASAASSFVYVAVHRPCATGTCEVPRLLVFDAATNELVTNSSLGTVPARPVGMAMSHDGRRLYISVIADDKAASLLVFDTTRHEMMAAHALPNGVAGSVAVTRDNRRVFIGAPQLVVWDVDTKAVLTTQAAGYWYVFGHTSLDRIIAVSAAAGLPPVPAITLHALDDTTGAVIAQKEGDLATHVSFAPDGSRVYGTYPATSIRPSSGGRTTIYSTASLDPIGSIAGFPSHAFDAPAAGRVVILMASGSQTTIREVDRVTLDVAASLTVPNSAVGGVVSGDDTRFWMGTSQAPPFSASTLTVFRLNPLALERTIPISLSPALLASTPPPGAAHCSYTVNPRQNSWAREGGTASITLSTGCAWITSSSANWLHVAADAASGTGSRTITVTVDPFFGGDASRSGTVTIGGQVVQFTQAGFGSQPAFGSFDTPTDGVTGVTGALAVTGWALDDVGVARVRIFRDGDTPGQQVYIGDATLVDGARPDVEAVFPSAPFASRAGWGYQFLTNMLPNGGNGTFRLHAYADDVDGHTTLLGSRTIHAANSTSTLPFGTIDTPGQGETVSGTIINFGWALSPNGINRDGSTIAVYIDNVFVGRPVYNQYRSDIATLFPNYMNSDGAVGYFQIDTTLYANGVHTIAWVVFDEAGQARGIGSRYFTIANP